MNQDEKGLQHFHKKRTCSGQISNINQNYSANALPTSAKPITNKQA